MVEGLRIYDTIKDLKYSEQLQHVLDDREIQHLLVCDPDGKREKDKYSKKYPNDNLI